MHQKSTDQLAWTRMDIDLFVRKRILKAGIETEFVLKRATDPDFRNSRETHNFLGKMWSIQCPADGDEHQNLESIGLSETAWVEAEEKKHKIANLPAIQ